MQSNGDKQDDLELSPAQAASRRFLFKNRAPLFATALVLAFAFYAAGLPSNPPGFYLDESSIAYNAYTISQTGADEFGNRWPLYFRAFGEYKNPVYVYLLAALFKLVGPGILAARLLSATLGFAAALMLGLLGLRISGNRVVGIILAITALLTPWLFELSRLVFEVALFPLVLILFLLLLHRAHTRAKWTVADSILIAMALALITYAYSIGRLLGPLLAIGLLFFANQKRWLNIIQTLLAYAVTLLPLFLFNLHNPGALTSRFYSLSYIRSTNTILEMASAFISHYLGNLSLWSLLVRGDPNPRHHVQGMGSILLPVMMLAITGAALILARYWRDCWWRFVLYGLAMSVIPASLTNDRFHSLRLAALPVFILLITVPAVTWLLANSKKHAIYKKTLIVLISFTFIQAGVFQWQFHRKGPERKSAFDVTFLEVFDAATATATGPVYLIDKTYAHARWYGVLANMDTSQFIRVDAKDRLPKDALVIGKKKPKQEHLVLRKDGRFRLYIISQE